MYVFLCVLFVEFFFCVFRVFRVFAVVRLFCDRRGGGICIRLLVSVNLLSQPLVLSGPRAYPLADRIL